MPNAPVSQPLSMLDKRDERAQTKLQLVVFICPEIPAAILGTRPLAFFLLTKKHVFVRKREI